MKTEIRRTNADHMQQVIKPAASLVLIYAALWKIANTPAIPDPFSVLNSLAFPQLGEHAWASISVVLMGVFAASVSGVGLAIATYLLPTTSVWLHAPILAIRNVSAIALFPAIIVVLGLGINAKLFVIFWTAFPPIWLNTHHAFHSIPDYLIDAARLDTDSRVDILRYIIFPMALPTIITGLQIGVGSGWISLVAAEMLGSQKGLGYVVLTTSQTFKYSRMYASIIWIAAAGGFMSLIVWAVKTIYITYTDTQGEYK